jgi:hypothetical protein
MRGIVLLLAVACSNPVPEVAADTARPVAPPPAAFSLSAPSVVAGAPVQFTVAGAPAGASISLAFTRGGLQTGSGCYPVLGGSCLDLFGFPGVVPGPVIADAGGNAAFQVTVPPAAAGRYVGFQAVILGGRAQLSNALGRVVGPVGAIINPNLDGDNDGLTPAGGDCDDVDPTAYPGALDQLGDLRDQDCDGADGVDGDGDGYVGGPGGSDCSDVDAAVFPGAAEVCDGQDQDCDGRVDQSRTGPACGLEQQFQAGDSPVDLLFVVDNSGSMAEEQARLSAISADFLDRLATAGLDAQVGVVTTDMDSNPGRLRSPLGQRWTSFAPGVDYATWFAAAVLAGTNGSSTERGLDAALAAVTPPLSTGFNLGFVRPDTDLHVVFLTDEEDYGAVGPLAWTANMLATRAPGHTFQAHGLIGPNPTGCLTADPGTRYDAVIRATLGEQGSVCLADYNAAMDEIATTLLGTSGGSQVFHVGAPADPSTILVEVDHPVTGVVVLAPADYTWDPTAQTITVTGVVLANQTRVKVSYDL